MTNMGINYLSYLETARSNRSKERETHRANTAQESLTAARDAETARSNLAREKETNRSNLANEALTRQRDAETRRSNLSREAETHRANVARETEEHRSNIANESIQSQRTAETVRSNLANEAIARSQRDETVRHNKVTESETHRANTIKALEGTKLGFNINAGVANLGVNVTGAAGYAAATDNAFKSLLASQAKADAKAKSKAEAERVLSTKGQSLIGTTYDSDEAAISAITSIPSEQRLNLKLTRDSDKKWKIVQNPNINPKTGKIKVK